MPKTTEIPGFAVIGMSTRTTNEDEMSGDGGKIGLLWKSFMHGGSKRIPGVLDPTTILSVYTNYESDHNGAQRAAGHPSGVDGRASIFRQQPPSPARLHRRFRALLLLRCRTLHSRSLGLPRCGRRLAFARPQAEAISRRRAS